MGHNSANILVDSDLKQICTTLHHGKLKKELARNKKFTEIFEGT